MDEPEEGQLYSDHSRDEASEPEEEAAEGDIGECQARDLHSGVRPDVHRLRSRWVLQEQSRDLSLPRLQLEEAEKVVVQLDRFQV